MSAAEPLFLPPLSPNPNAASRLAGCGDQSEGRLEQRVFDALPANIAVVDGTGTIVCVNEAWRLFAAANGLDPSLAGPGIDYLAICDHCSGSDQKDARIAAEGIRQVLRGEVNHFEFEYPCHSTTEKRWFRLVASPLAPKGAAGGALIMHLDISERKLAEDLLRENEARMAAAQRVGRFGSWEIDLTLPEEDRTRLHWSDQMYRLCGYEPGEVQITSPLFFSWIPADDVAAIKEAVQKAIRLDQPYSIVHRLTRKDGQEILLEETAQVFREPGTGRPLKLMGTAHDVTEKHRARAAILASEERFQLAVRGSAAGIWDWNLVTNELYCSPRYAEMLGYSLDEVKPDLSLYESTIHPDDLERVRAMRKNHLEGRTQLNEVEMRLRTKSGDYKWFNSRGQAVWDETGRPVRMAGSIIDITDRKLAEEQIREQAALLDETQDAIHVTDLNHRVLFWSKAAEKLYGWTRDEMVKREGAGFLLADQNVFTAIADIVLRTGQWSGELQKRARDGRILLVHSRCSLVRDASGRPKSILTVDSDITEQKKLQTQFLRAQRMESIGTLAGGIAHDLNNVLAPILMIADLLRDKAPPEDFELIDTIRASAERGANLVKQVLSFARGVHGQRVRVEPARIVQDLQKLIQETFPKSIRLQVSLPAAVPDILGDPIQIHQVLLNLAVNARDAMENGGKLFFGIQVREVDETFAGMHPEAKAGSYVAIEVSDSGSGIPMDLQVKIFEPFFTTKDIGKGTGLGLSTAMAIVKSHGGFITLRSHPGEGSTFEVYLPANAPAVQSEPQRAASLKPPQGNGETILVIDDEQSIRDVTSKTLAHFGYKVLLAANGAEGVALYAQHKDAVALVVTDMAMPVMDGPTTIAALHRLNPDLPIITCSGFAAKARHESGSTAVYAFIPKPYTTQVLLSAVAGALGK